MRLSFRQLFKAGVVMSLLVSPWTQAGDYSQNPKAQAFIDNVVSKHGFDRQQVQGLIDQAQKKQSILDAIARPAEKTKEWHEYRDIFVTPVRIKQGLAFWKEHEALLAEIEADFGVDAATIVSILGVETRFGRLRGGYRVLDALATLGFDYPPRAKFFAGQFEQFLLMTKEQGLKPEDLTGSYAGAMGWGQFIPSSYRSFAIDYDGDKVADIWDNPRDAIASVANYFKKHGWKTGEPVVYPAKLAKNADTDLPNSSKQLSWTVTELAEKGFSVDTSSLSHGIAGSTVSGEQRAMILRLLGVKGEEHWIALNNFYVITRYNHSKLYAMAVNQLREELVAQRDLSL
jgi:membrane-bound lytic murein transglycosylase B